MSVEDKWIVIFHLDHSLPKERQGLKPLLFVLYDAGANVRSTERQRTDTNTTQVCADPMQAKAACMGHPGQESQQNIGRAAPGATTKLLCTENEWMSNDFLRIVGARLVTLNN